MEKLAATDEDERIAPAFGDQRDRDNRLTERGRGREDAVIVGSEVREGPLLGWRQFSPERQAVRQRLAKFTTIFLDHFDPKTLRKRHRLVETTARQRHMARMEFGARDDARFSGGRKAHRLCPVKLGILEWRQADELRNEWRGSSALSMYIWSAMTKFIDLVRGPTYLAGPLRREGGIFHGSSANSSWTGIRTPSMRPDSSASSAIATTASEEFRFKVDRKAHWSS